MRDTAGSINPAAVHGFDAAATIYERARPGYPSEAVDFLVEATRARERGPVVDLGAGTGKLTKELIARGLPCIAVEPVAAMCGALATTLPGVHVVQAPAEAIPLADGVAGTVVVAQAFHWFDVPKATAEIHRILQPHGRFALLWYVRDTTVDWAAKLEAIVAPHEGSVRIPRRHERARHLTPGPDLPFALIAEREFRHDHPMTPDALADRVSSVSYVASLPSEGRARVLQQVHDLVANHPDLQGAAEFFDPSIIEISILERS
jgi:SAM-dependent methyltransferase